MRSLPRITFPCLHGYLHNIDYARRLFNEWPNAENRQPSRQALVVVEQAKRLHELIARWQKRFS